VAKGELPKRFFADRLRTLREQAGFTQESFAEAAGIPYKTYQTFEAGRRTNLEIKTIQVLASAYGLTLSEFFSEALPKTKVRAKPEARPKRVPPPQKQK